MNNKKGSFLTSESFNAAASSIFAIIIGLAFGFIILLASNPSNAVSGLGTILFGVFEAGGRGIGQVLYLATPIIMTGLSVGFAFKTGLFNIGASGQFIMGAVTALYVGYYWTFIPGPLHWVVALIMATLVGAVWGIIPGILKAYLNVHEVIATIMMNYIGMYTCNYIVRTYVFDPSKNRSIDVAPTAEIPKAGLDKVFSTHVGNYLETSVVNLGIVIAIVIAILVYITLEKTKFGYELKAVGYNKNASKYAGINEKRSIILSLAIAGALAGLGGALLYLSGPTGRHINVVDELAPEGFNGIPVALLGLSNPIGIIFSALFIAFLNQGGTYLQSLGYIPEVINMIIAVIIYFSAFALVLRKIIPTTVKYFEGKKKAKTEVVTAAAASTTNENNYVDGNKGGVE